MLNKTMQRLIDATKWTEAEAAKYSRSGEPMLWSNDSDTRKSHLAKALADYAVTGTTGDEEQDKEIKKALQGLTIDDARKIAKELITLNNYSEYDPFAITTDGMDAATLALYDRLREEYNGIDAYIYMAEEELAGNIMGKYADEARLVDIMTEALQ